MNTFFPNWRISDINAEFAPAANIVANIGDLCIYNGTNPVPASCQANLASPLLMQANIAKNFLGIFNSSRLLNDANVVAPVRIMIDGIWEFDVGASSSFAINDLIGANVNTGNIILNQKVDKVAAGHEHLAIGRVVQKATSVTKIKARIMSRYLLGMPDRFRDIGGVGQGYASNVANLGGNAVLLANDAPSQVLNANTANRVVTLPGACVSQGLVFYITNSCTTDHSLTINSDAGVALTVLANAAAPGKSAIAWCDDTQWKAIQGA